MFGTRVHGLPVWPDMPRRAVPTGDRTVGLQRIIAPAVRRAPIPADARARWLISAFRAQPRAACDRDGNIVVAFRWMTRLLATAAACSTFQQYKLVCEPLVLDESDAAAVQARQQISEQLRSRQLGLRVRDASLAPKFLMNPGRIIVTRHGVNVVAAKRVDVLNDNALRREGRARRANAINDRSIALAAVPDAHCEFVGRSRRGINKAVVLHALNRLGFETAPLGAAVHDVSSYPCFDIRPYGIIFRVEYAGPLAGVLPRFITSGLRIEHRNKNAPDFVVFWTPHSSALLKQLASMGYQTT